MGRNALASWDHAEEEKRKYQALAITTKDKQWYKREAGQAHNDAGYADDHQDDKITSEYQYVVKDATEDHQGTNDDDDEGNNHTPNERKTGTGQREKKPSGASTTRAATATTRKRQ